MNAQHKYEIQSTLTSNCSQCHGFCCVALYFSKSDGFPKDKQANEPCLHLESDFTCRVHDTLQERGLKGCSAYDCFGAGQKTAQHTCGGKRWNCEPKAAEEMFSAFLKMRQLHEMLWYLMQAASQPVSFALCNDVFALAEKLDAMTRLSMSSLGDLSVSPVKHAVDAVLRSVSASVRSKASKSLPAKVTAAKWRTRKDLFGVSFINKDIRGADFSGAFLIAADFAGADFTGTDLLGADLRDANLCGANLEHCIYLSQMQLNTAVGDWNTRLPSELQPPKHWNSKR